MTSIGETFDLSSFFGSCWTFKTSAINRSAISPCLKNQRRLLYQGFEAKSTEKMVKMGLVRAYLHLGRGVLLLCGQFVSKGPFYSAGSWTYVWEILDGKSSAIDTEFMV